MSHDLVRVLLLVLHTLNYADYVTPPSFPLDEVLHVLSYVDHMLECDLISTLILS